MVTYVIPDMIVPSLILRLLFSFQFHNGKEQLGRNLGTIPSCFNFGRVYWFGKVAGVFTKQLVFRE